MEEQKLQVQKKNEKPKTCFFCKKEIEVGANYHFAKIKAGPYRYMHVECWNKHKTGGRWKNG